MCRCYSISGTELGGWNLKADAGDKNAQAQCGEEGEGEGEGQPWRYVPGIYPTNLARAPSHVALDNLGSSQRRQRKLQSFDLLKI